MYIDVLRTQLAAVDDFLVKLSTELNLSRRVALGRSN